MVALAKREIGFTVIKVNEDCNLMLDVMQNSFASQNSQAQFQITDLAKVC
jgi:hypothetical protein